MKADLLLSHCRKVKKTGNDSWIACCPSHEDKNPSMTVRELDDGRVLVHCFAGCSVEMILDSVGLSFDALFPDKPIEHAPRLKRAFPAADVLLAVEHELLVMVMVASDLAAGKAVPEAALERIHDARARIEEARRLSLG